MELEFKGTKYEWKYLPHESKDRTHTVREIKADGTSICIVRTNNQEQAEANAKLIASAPSLLEALQYTLEQLKGLDGNNPTEKIIIEKCEKAIEKALK